MNSKYFLDLEENQVVIFVDIIGFSDLIKKSEHNKEADLAMGDLMIRFPEIYDLMVNGEFSNSFQEDMGIKFLWISDSIIISSNKENINNLMRTLDDIINKLYCIGFALRGGIAIGKLYHQVNIWGVPYIKAVELEKRANYPRIIIEESDLQQLDLSDEDKKYFIFDAKDNFWYYNYFASFLSRKIKRGENISCYLSEYSSFISKSFEDCSKKKHKLKWIWLAEKFRETLEYNKIEINKLLENNIVYETVPPRQIESYQEYIKKLEKVRE